MRGVFPFTNACGFVLSKCLQPSFVVSQLFFFHGTCERWNKCTDISGTSLSSSKMGSPNGSLLDLGTGYRAERWSRKSTKSTCSYRSSYRVRLVLKIASRRLLRQCLSRRLKLQILNKLLGALLLALPLWKKLQLLAPVSLTRQDLGIYLEIQGVDLILSQLPKMDSHEVPYYYGSHVNSSTLDLRSGSILVGKRQSYQPTINLSQFIARQNLCRPDLYLKQEPNVKTLWHLKMMVSYTKLTVPSAAPKNHHGVSIQVTWRAGHGKTICVLVDMLAEKLKFLLW